MPGKKGKKSGGSKKKGGKKGKKSADSESSGKVVLDPNPIPRYLDIKAPPSRLDTMKAILSENKIQEKDIMGTKVPSHVLEYLTPSEVRDLQYVFNTMDRVSRGAIGARDLRRALRGLGFQVEPDEVDGMIKDRGGSSVTFFDFLDIVIARQADSMEVYEELNQSWKLFNPDNNPHLTLDDLKAISHSVGMNLSDKDVKEMMEMADKNGNGKLEQEELVEVLMRTNIFEDVDLLRMKQFDK